MSDKEIFTREETSNLIQQAKREGALEELKYQHNILKSKWKNNIKELQVLDEIQRIEYRIKELEGDKK